jgi:hypothetical protein
VCFLGRALAWRVYFSQSHVAVAVLVMAVVGGDAQPTPDLSGPPTRTHRQSAARRWGCGSTPPSPTHPVADPQIAAPRVPGSTHIGYVLPCALEAAIRTGVRLGRWWKLAGWKPSQEALMDADP